MDALVLALAVVVLVAEEVGLGQWCVLGRYACGPEQECRVADETSLVSKCTGADPLGAKCPYANFDTCVSGSSCFDRGNGTGRVCTATTGAGDPCDADTACQEGTSCKNGTCTWSAVRGEKCVPKIVGGCSPGFTCDTRTRTCEAITDCRKRGCTDGSACIVDKGVGACVVCRQGTFVGVGGCVVPPGNACGPTDTCAAGTVCNGGICTPEAGNRSLLPGADCTTLTGVQCPVGTFCAFSGAALRLVCLRVVVIGGYCLPPYDICPQGAVCEPSSGRCVIPTRAGHTCTSVSLCEHGGSCRAGKCTSGCPNGCILDGVCVDKICRKPVPLNAPCEVEGVPCVDGAECRRTRDGKGHLVQFCIPVGSPCRLHQDCPKGAACGDDFRCNPVMLVGEPVPRVTDVPCQPGADRNSQGICDWLPAIASRTACIHSSSCPKGAACLPDANGNLICQPLLDCRVYGCRRGEACNLATFKCESCVNTCGSFQCAFDVTGSLLCFDCSRNCGGAGEFCSVVTGECVPGPAQCGLPCPMGHVCVEDGSGSTLCRDNAFEPIDAPCYAALPCPEDSYCSHTTGTCRPLASYCTDSTVTCLGTLRCIVVGDNQPQCLPRGFMCKNKECGAGEECVPSDANPIGECRLLPRCHNCTDSEYCVDDPNRHGAGVCLPLVCSLVCPYGSADQCQAADGRVNCNYASVGESCVAAECEPNAICASVVDGRVCHAFSSECSETCAPGSYCVLSKGKHKCAFPSYLDPCVPGGAPCPLGSECRDGRCESDTCGGVKCQAGSSCQRTNEGASCVAIVGATCTEDIDCPYNHACLRFSSFALQGMCTELDQDVVPLDTSYSEERSHIFVVAILLVSAVLCFGSLFCLVRSFNREKHLPPRF